jgi:dTDP-4-amino-4,6-dideoxygalactose transaminase
VLVDCDPSTHNIDPGLLEGAVTQRTKAVIVVHSYGQPADIDAVRRVTDRYGLYLIEDVAQAHGASYKGIRCGALGHAGCFSFYPTKNLGAYGDGGMVTTNDAALAERIRILRNYGQRVKYHHRLP